MTVRFWGVRGSIPAPGFETARYGGNTSCVEVRAGDSILILDAGSGARNLGSALVEEFGSRPITANLLISHTHWDHIQGLPFFAPLYAPQNRIRIFIANGNLSELDRGLRNQMQSLHFPISLDEMRGLASLGELNSHLNCVGEFQIEKMALNHPGGCAGFRISARGATIAYLPDHEPHRYSRNGESGANIESHREAVLRFVRGVDLLILDTQYTELEYRKHIGWGHGCLTDSVALAIDAGVERLLFFHHDPSHTDVAIDDMVNDARKLAASVPIEIEAAAEGQCIKLGSAITRGRSLLTPTKSANAPIFATAARRKISFPARARS